MQIPRNRTVSESQYTVNIRRDRAIRGYLQLIRCATNPLSIIDARQRDKLDPCRANCRVFAPRISEFPGVFVRFFPFYLAPSHFSRFTSVQAGITCKFLSLRQMRGREATKYAGGPNSTRFAPPRQMHRTQFATWSVK